MAFGTGGTRARLWVSEDYGAHWQARHAPLRQGVDSAGLFSLAGTAGAAGADATDTEWIAVGGDYRADRERREVAFVTRDRGLSWSAIVPPPAGFRSAVEPLPAALGGGWVATGTSGTDIAASAAAGFEALSVEGFHAVRAAKRGQLVVLAGAAGVSRVWCPPSSPRCQSAPVALGAEPLGRFRPASSLEVVQGS